MTCSFDKDSNFQNGRIGTFLYKTTWLKRSDSPLVLHAPDAWASVAGRRKGIPRADSYAGRIPGKIKMNDGSRIVDACARPGIAITETNSFAVTGAPARANPAL